MHDVTIAVGIKTWTTVGDYLNGVGHAAVRESSTFVPSATGLIHNKRHGY